MLLNWLESTFNRIVLIRVIIITVLFGSSSIIYLLNDRVKVVLYLIIVILLVYISSLANVLVNSYSEKYRNYINIFQILLDIFLSTIVITVTGGVSSPFIFLFALIIIYTNIIYSKRIISYSMSFILSLLFLLIIVTKPKIFLSDESFQLSFQASFDIDHNSLIYTYFNLAGFLLVSMLSGFLSERVRLARIELGESKRSLDILQNLNDNILRSLDSAVITLDLEGKITSANRKSLEILNIGNIEDILNKHLSIYIQGIDVEEIISKKREQILYTTSHGEMLTLGFSSSVLTDEDNDILGYILIFQDLTEIKILEDKLRHSEKLAILGKLSSGLAHEIRNPLAAISGAIEILGSEVDPSTDNKRLIDVASREVERMNLLVDDFSILTNPLQKVNTPVELGVVVTDTIRTFTKTIKRSDIEVNSELEEGVYVNADTYRLKQSFWNMFVNSMQSIEGEGLIDIQVYTENGRAVIKISDNGCGICSKDISRIFEPFYSTKKTGTGLGLAIVHKVIESYNGKIDVISSEDKGTTFFITLPVVSMDA